jgi:hypothetical protein
MMYMMMMMMKEGVATNDRELGAVDGADQIITRDVHRFAI